PLTLSVTDASVKLNRAGGGATKFNWQSFSDAHTTLPTIAVDAATDLHVSGTVTVTLTGLFSATGTASIDIGQATEPTTVGTDAQATALSLTFAVTGGGAGASGTLALVSIKQGLKSWLGVDSTGISVGLNAVPGLNLAVTDGGLKLNKSTGAAKIDWTTFDPVSGITLPHLDVDQSVDLHVSGRFTGDIFGILTGSVHFSLDQETKDANVDGSPGFDTTPGHDLLGASLALFSLSFQQGDSLLVGTDGFGLSITDGSIAIAVLSSNVAGDARRWIAV